MTGAVRQTTESHRKFAVIDDGNWRGVIAPKSLLSSRRLAMLIDDLEDTDPKFLNKIHEEYHQTKINNSFIPSSKIEEELDIQ
jgi:hypothetical protein